MNGRIGFFSLEPTKDKKGYLGAILVTDDLGKPEEFRVTYPVKPTLLQRQLYGESLTPHIGVNLCGTPLLKDLKSDIDVLVVGSVDYLPISKEANCHVVFLEKIGEAIKVGDDGDTESISLRIASKSGRFQPISAIFSNSYTEEDQEEVNKQLTSFYEMFDLLEPFERMTGAMEALAEQDPRFV